MYSLFVNCLSIQLVECKVLKGTVFGSFRLCSALNQSRILIIERGVPIVTLSDKQSYSTEIINAPGPRWRDGDVRRDVRVDASPIG
jgi:hypothetical protein